MKLYFGNTVTTVTTLMILALLGFVGYSVVDRANIQYWGRRSLLLLIFGLVICCFAATRDRRQLCTRSVSVGQCSHGCRLHRCADDYRGSHRHPHRQIAASARNLVLYHVRRRNREDCDYGDRPPLDAVISFGGKKHDTELEGVSPQSGA